MAQPDADATIKYLEHELDHQEKLIQMMESPGASEDRIAALEKKVREMEALVKGLTQELLDLKSIAMKMSKQTEERSRQELKRGPIVQQGAAAPAAAPAYQSASGSTVIRPKSRAPEVPEAPAEPAMDMIMQPDGTMKLEPRRGDKDYIVASAGYGRNKKGGSRPKQGELIYATEDDKKADPAKK